METARVGEDHVDAAFRSIALAHQFIRMAIGHLAAIPGEIGCDAVETGQRLCDGLERYLSVVGDLGRRT